ncbi:MAG: methyltransferase [Rhodospirillaceae bacterium]|nr:MAG: methyltransferase [Rhodospirillaceae bacterium]
MRQGLKNVLVGFVRLLINLFGQGWRRRVAIVLREAMSSNGFDEVIKDIETKRGTISFYCLDSLPLWRAETLLTKEPETIEWIDAIDDGEVLFDIGANVGVYTLYAAINKKIKVLAFEPLAANYFLINRNIERNNISDVASAYCIALNDQDLISNLHIQNTGFGSAISSFDDPVDYNGEQFSAKFLQGMIGMSLDSFIKKFDPPFPNHLKIDVDGIEDKIIKGAVKTLADPRLKSISIELDADRPEYTEAVVKDIEAGGLKLVDKRHAELFEDTIYAHIYNYQFKR